jgi:signal transduction histidine kinase/GAF domain-containing protein
MASSEASKNLSMAERFAALSRVGAQLLREFDEERLLHLIAETACELTGATFAAFSLRPVNETGQPLVPSEGNLFHLAAVIGVTEEQEALFRHMPLGGEGLLAPIFQYGVSVRVDDVLAHLDHGETQHSGTLASRSTARDQASAYAQGRISAAQLHSLGIPHGHPDMRSFLGAPLLDREGHVRGGLLLGHTLPAQFSDEDEMLLVGLASQAAVAVENERLYRSAQMHAQELQAVVDSSADGITQIDGNGQIVRENLAAKQLREHLLHEREGEQALDQIFFAPARLALDEKMEQQRSVTVHYEGEDHEYLVTASPLRSPHVSGRLPDESHQPLRVMIGTVVVLHEVTEIRHLLFERQRHAETEVQRALLQRILDELPSSVYLVHGKDARLVLANRAATTVLGAQWLSGQPMQDFLAEKNVRIFGMDGRPLSFEHLATIRAVSHGETVYQHQEVIRHPDGTTLPVLVNAVVLTMHDLDISSLSEPTTNGEGQELAALVVHQDVSALKEAERLKDDFISIAAHELRNPLAILKGFAQTLIVQTARQHGPELADWQMEALQGIDQATIRLVELTDDLLDVSRLQSGQLTLHLIPTNLAALTQRVIARLQMTTENHHLVMHCDVQQRVVQIDSQRMEQVLSNLLINAIKYSPEGGTIQIHLTSSGDEKEILLSVQDQGIGIPFAQQSHIFGRFVRGENARTYGIGGTGLGLYLCRELVEQQGGRIWFQSVEGQGSTFSIALQVLFDEEDT